MSVPTVCAVMLTRDRPELAAKAVECFRRQTYENKRLLVVNSDQRPLFTLESIGPGEFEAFPGDGNPTIGGLRNWAADWVCDGPWPLPEILIHFDDDDWSHPNRITEQVALLQASGADVVGYSEMLFWRTFEHFGAVDGSQREPEAWLFQCAKQLTPAVGTSLCYWRKTWERTKFADLPRGPGGQSEYREFLRNNKVVTDSSIVETRIPGVILKDPRMIARIHGANFSPYNIEEQIARGSNAMPNEGWTRLPDWDARVREILEAK